MLQDPNLEEEADLCQETRKAEFLHNFWVNVGWIGIFVLDTGSRWCEFPSWSGSLCCVLGQGTFI